MRMFVRVLATQELLAPVGVAAEIALGQIPGLSDAHAESENENSAVLSYQWNRPGETFDRIDTHLSIFHLKRDWVFDRDPGDPLIEKKPTPQNL